MKVEDSMIHFIKQYKQQKILLAISGGQDSILLIKSLDNLKNYSINKKIRITYIYIDHQWKNNSNKQIKHLINYLKSKNNEIIIYQINKITLSEKECRQYRYNIIIQYAISNKYQLIITGHNLTDKIETFINNISRSSHIESFNSLSITNKIHKNIFFLDHY